MDAHFKIQDSLAALAVKIDSAASGIAALQRLSGGATQEIWRFELSGPGQNTPLILRRSTTKQMNTSFLPLEQEAKLILAVAGAGVPVPPVRYILRPEDGLGSGFVMNFLEGETLGPRIVKSPALADARVLLAQNCGEVLARIHGVDIAAFSSLPHLTAAALVQESQALYKSSAWPRPVFELAFRWVKDHCPPPPATPRLVHGDFRNGNLMIGPDGIRAVLDWELAHIGDPTEDLAWICVNSWRFGEIDKPVGGFGSLSDLLSAYAAAGGQDVDPSALKWWEIFGSLRWGVMCAGSAAEFRSVSPTIERAMIARRASETEIDLLRLLAV